VIDSSDAPVREKNEELVRKFGGKYYYESRRRLAVARNTGIRKASGDIIIFTDDDSIVHKGWIENLISNCEHPDTICCNGRVLSYREDDSSKLFEKYITFDRGPEKQVFSSKDISILKLLKATILLTRNRTFHRKFPAPWSVGGDGFCSFRKRIFTEIGYFDEDLGKGDFSTGEDLDMMHRILKKTQYKIVYEPTAIVYHNHPHTLEAISRFAYNYGSIRPVFYKKYWKDIYMLPCFLGSFLLRFSTLIKSILWRDHELRKIMVSDFRGFLSSFRR